MEDVIGRLKSALADRYTIERELGGGGMATVYLAEDRKHRRHVAIKVLKPELAAALGPERFLREIEIAAQLNHPHILPLLDSGEADGFLYYVMPYVEGESLRRRIKHEIQLSIEEALRITRQVASALEYAHRHHVIHRDVKPENILLHEGEAMVADFGIALAVAVAGGERLTETGLSLGTPEYMSPEQATGDPHLDARSDIYSLGCVLFEMLAGEPPYTGSTAQVVISKRLTEPLPRLGAVRDTVSVAVEQAVTRALEKVPADRYRTAEEFAEALARASTGEAVPGRALGPAEASEPMQGRSWRRVAAAVMAGIGLIGATWWVVTTIAPGSGAIERLAVLPLENLTGDPEQEYFVEGMHDALINELGQIRALTVISRRSAMRYRDTDKSVPEIARELSVDAVVEGSALQVGDRVRISAQLIEAATDRQLWANDYERDMRDVLSLHKEVARDIADQIRVTLTPQEESGLESAPPVNQEVYELYLKGRHLCVKWTPEDGNKAIEYLQQAIEIDRSYAPSYGELAICYVLLGFFDYLLPQEAYPKARAAATRALDADERLPEAHVALGAVSWYFDWNAPEAEREYKRAVELNPSHSDAHLWLAFFLGEIGRWDEAIAAARRAQELDPLSVMANNAAGEVFYLKREYDRAAEAFGKNLDLEPTNAGNHYYIAWPYEQQGMYEEAIAELETAVRLSQGLPIYAASLGHAYALAGRNSEALEILNQLQEQRTRIPPSPYHVALVYIGLGDKENAFEWLEKAYVERRSYLVFLKEGPRFDTLRDDPRFTDLLRRMNLLE